MPRTLPKNKSPKQQLIINATWDYYGSGDMIRANQVALWLMGRRSGVSLTEEELLDANAIKQNLEDEIYVKSFE